MQRLPTIVSFSVTQSRRMPMAAAVAALLFVAPVSAIAGPGPCAVTNHYVAGNVAFAASFPPASHTGCTLGVPSGAATQCSRATMGESPSSNFFFARWPSVAARTGDTTGGCSFMCTSGDCRVGRDGLPVELLEFAVR